MIATVIGTSEPRDIPEGLLDLAMPLALL
jgi:hypothetical protein